MIDSFSGKNHFLSNFYHPITVEYEGMDYISSEHAFQAAKTTDPMKRRLIQSCSTPGKAKRMGKSISPICDGWDNLKLTIMQEILDIKFSDELLASMLLATGEEELVEGNWWGDTFWGVCGPKGENNLGKLLMVLRERIRSSVLSAEVLST